MNPATSFFFRLATAVCLTLVAGVARPQALVHQDHPLSGKLWDMGSRRFIDEATLLARAKPADILVLGETHDNPVHHERQQRLLLARLESGASPALVMEQFNTDRQSELDLALADADRSDALQKAAGLAKGWDWQFYRPLVSAALERKLPVVAANLSRERVRPVIREGFAAFDSADFKRLAVEAVWNDGRQRYLSEVIEASHCGQIDANMREGLVRAQRLRDAVMADAVLANVQRGVVAIVGRGHARRDVGLPLYLAARQPSARVYSIGLVEVDPAKTSPEAYETARGEGMPFDVLWFSPRTERPDPCAAFAKR